MLSNDEVYPLNLDFVWLGRDRAGHVGAFITAGTGPVPRAVLAMPDYLEVEDELLALPIAGDAIVVVRYSDTSSMLALAARGVFVYDWVHRHAWETPRPRGYNIVASPARAVHVGDLPSSIQGRLSDLVAPDRALADHLPIDAPHYVECVEAPAGF